MARIASAPAGVRWDPKYTDGFYVFDLAALALQEAYRKRRRFGNTPAIARILVLQESGARPTHHVDNRRGRRPWQHPKGGAS
jgi:hypothetical protein